MVKDKSNLTLGTTRVGGNKMAAAKIEGIRLKSVTCKIRSKFETEQMNKMTWPSYRTSTIRSWSKISFAFRSKVQIF